MNPVARISSWRRKPPAEFAQLALLLAPAALLFAGGFVRRWIGDDGFINVRVAKQLLAGHGLVFNHGERVEAITSPLWTLLIAAAGGVGLRIEAAAAWLGLALSALGMLLASLASLRAQRRLAASDAWFIPLGAVAYAAVPAGWDYVTSGLENGLGLGWFGLSALLTFEAISEPRAKSHLHASFVLGLAPLVRPDYVVLGAPLGLLLVVTSPSRRALFATVALAALPGLVWQLFRMGYYAALVPNTALAKEAFEARWAQGLHYLRHLVRPYGLQLPLMIVLALQLTNLRHLWESERRRASLFILAVALGGVLHGLYVVRLGGDFMHGRMLLPALFAIFSSFAFLRFERPIVWRGAGHVVACLVVLVWATVCAARFRTPRDNQDGIGDERGWHAREARRRNPVRLSHYKHFFFYDESLPLKEEIVYGCEPREGALEPGSDVPCRKILLLHPEDEAFPGNRRSFPLAPGVVPDEVVAVVSMPPLGIAGNLLGLRVNLVDPYGLADPHAARMRLVARARPGHEKYFSPVWLAAKFALPGVLKDRNVEVAAEVLRCPLPEELTRATRDELTWERFVANLRLAYTLHTLRIPEDPHEAKRELCGAAAP